MAKHTALITGASGYIGGTLLKYIKNDANLSSQIDIIALVRSDTQAEEVAKLGAKAIRFDFYDEEASKAAVIEHDVTIVLHLADPAKYSPLKGFTDGVAEVSRKTGVKGHVVHTSGAKLFSHHAGLTSKDTLSDRDVFTTHKAQRSWNSWLNEALDTNTTFLEYAESKGVNSYIIVPPMVYGEGEGFGNKISIQIVALVRAGKALGQLYQVTDAADTWTLCQISDLTTLYLALLRSILTNSDIPSGPSKNGGGIYFAENGSFSWVQLSQSIASRLEHHGLAKSTNVEKASDADLEKIGNTLGCPKDFVPIQIAGFAALRGDQARDALGWKPKYDVQHLMSVVDKEVDFILKEDKK